MIKLCLDTSFDYLTIVILNKNNELIDGISYECSKQQSEKLQVEISKIFHKNNLLPADIEGVYVSIGPGSYTGLRIALTFAKVFCSLNKVDLYTISTLKLYANNSNNTMVIMNARSKRAYVGVYDKSETILNDTIMNIEDIPYQGYSLVGDLSLIEQADFKYNIIECFINTISNFEKVVNVDLVVPVYLKRKEDYYAI